MAGLSAGPLRVVRARRESGVDGMVVSEVRVC